MSLGGVKDVYGYFFLCLLPFFFLLGLIMLLFYAMTYINISLRSLV